MSIAMTTTLSHSLLAALVNLRWLFLSENVIEYLINSGHWKLMRFRELSFRMGK